MSMHDVEYNSLKIHCDQWRDARSLMERDYQNYVTANERPSYQFTCTQAQLKTALKTLPNTKVPKFRPELAMSMVIVVANGTASFGRYNNEDDRYVLSSVGSTDGCDFISMFVGDMLSKFVAILRDNFTFTFYSNRVVIKCGTQRITFKAMDTEYYYGREPKAI